MSQQRLGAGALAGAAIIMAMVAVLLFLGLVLRSPDLHDASVAVGGHQVEVEIHGHAQVSATLIAGAPATVTMIDGPCGLDAVCSAAPLRGAGTVLALVAGPVPQLQPRNHTMALTQSGSTAPTAAPVGGTQPVVIGAAGSPTEHSGSAWPQAPHCSGRFTLPTYHVVDKATECVVDLITPFTASRRFVVAASSLKTANPVAV